MILELRSPDCLASALFQLSNGTGREVRTSHVLCHRSDYICGTIHIDSLACENTYPSDSHRI